MEEEGRAHGAVRGAEGDVNSLDPPREEGLQHRSGAGHADRGERGDAAGNGLVDDGIPLLPGGLLASSTDLAA